MDRTLLYRELIRYANPGADTVIEPLDAPDAFSEQCLALSRSITALQRHLAEVRGAYLATGRTQLSPAQCDEIDYDVHRILQQNQQQIRKLEAAETAGAARKSTGLRRLLADPKIEGARKTLDRHRKGMLVYLNSQLRDASETHLAQQQARAERLRGRRNRPPVLPRPPPKLEEPAPALELDLPPETQQTLLLENSELMGELQARLDQALQAERSMREISEIQTELAAHLSVQTETIGHLMDDAFKTTDDVGGANVQLEQARNRNRRTSKIIIYAAIIIALILLIFDWIL